jgi:hypothetical protein
MFMTPCTGQVEENLLTCTGLKTLNFVLIFFYYINIEVPETRLLG